MTEAADEGFADRYSNVETKHHIHGVEVVFT